LVGEDCEKDGDEGVPKKAKAFGVSSLHPERSSEDKLLH
jgi:hypothetical protein